MLQVSYSDLYEIEHHREEHQDIVVGDLVRTGPNLYPHYAVIAIHGEKAWVRDVNNGMDGLTSLRQCRKINGPA